MDSIITIYHHWANKILNGTKPFEFRSNLGKDINIGDTVYIYEAKSYGGSGMVVGQFTIEDIIKFENKAFIEKYFMEYYTRKILKDNEKADKYKNNLQYELTHYKPGAVIDFLLSDVCVEFLKKDEYPPIDILISNKDVEEGKKIVSEVSDWLTDLGCFDEDGRTYYKYAFKVSNVQKYSYPISIENFRDLNGNNIKKAPRSWRYVV